jgi:hypothetical protein
VGPGGIAQGGGLRIGFPDSGWPVLQTDRPGEAGYVSASAGPEDFENLPPLTVTAAAQTAEIRTGAPLSPGDGLLITVFSEAFSPQGGPTVQDHRERCFSLRVDAAGDGDYRPFPHPLCLP